MHARLLNLESHTHKYGIHKKKAFIYEDNKLDALL